MALGKLLMVQNLSLSDLQPALHPSHFAPGKEQIFHRHVLPHPKHREEKKPQPTLKQTGKYKYWIMRSPRARGNQNNFSHFYQEDNIHREQRGVKQKK